MSLSINRSFRGTDPTQALVELDEQSLIAQPEEYPLCRGPFGVFQLQPALSINPCSIPPANSSPRDTIEQPITMSESTVEFFDSISLDFALADVIDDSALFSDNISPCTDSHLMPDANAIAMNNDEEDSYFQQMQDFALQINPSPLLSNTSPLSEDSWPLLANYRDRVIPLLAPLNTNEKSPWHHIVLPCAMNTMAEMAMGGSTSHARIALLYVLLATSATHVQLSSSSIPKGSGHAVAYYKQRARHELKKCLQKEASASHKIAKYKDVLMALISMAILNVRFWYLSTLLLC